MLLYAFRTKEKVVDVPQVIIDQKMLENCLHCVKFHTIFTKKRLQQSKMSPSITKRSICNFIRKYQIKNKHKEKERLNRNCTSSLYTCAIYPKQFVFPLN